MSMSAAVRMQLKNAIERVLHVQGNYTGGILEMAIVIDRNLQKEEAAQRAKDLVQILKSQNEIFRNVRLNTILWGEEPEFIKQVTALPLLQTGSFFESYSSCGTEKQWDNLLSLLKKFYARSKLILVLSDEDFTTQNKTEAQTHMQPFLHKKLILLSQTHVKTGTQMWRELLT